MKWSKSLFIQLLPEVFSLTKIVQDLPRMS